MYESACRNAEERGEYWNSKFELLVSKSGKVSATKALVLGEEVVEEKRDEAEAESNRGIGGTDCGN